MATSVWFGVFLWVGRFGGGGSNEDQKTDTHIHRGTPLGLISVLTVLILCVFVCDSMFEDDTPKGIIIVFICI